MARTAVLALVAMSAGIPLFLLATVEVRAQDFSRPASYDTFVSVTTYPSVADAIQNEQHLYFPAGQYFLDNPIIIDRNLPLFLHGGDRMVTRLRANDTSKPLFIVKAATLINVAGLRFWPAFDPSNGSSTATNTRNFLFENQVPIQFEMQDSFVDQSILDIQGPGSFRLQGVVLAPGGVVQTAVMVNHPEADFLMVGGNISNGPWSAQGGAAAYHFHLWQKRGRLRVYGTGTQAALGIADFRIDTPAPQGPHVIANVRSEGANGANGGTFPSAHLYVPPSSQKVDVLFMNNSGSWPEPGDGASHYVDYSAAGTLWMLGNNSTRGAGRLVVGNAPSATIVAVGNRLYDNADILPITGATKIFAGTVYSHNFLTGDSTEPVARFVNSTVSLNDYTSIPPVPEVDIPMPIGRPLVNVALPGMIDVSAAPYNAAGDGITDDTAAIQAAFNAGKVIYLPAGTYRTTQPLGFVHSVYGGVSQNAGGWIAGAGSSVTSIVRDLADKGSVFLSEGMADATVQGISFVTAAYNPADASPIQAPNVALENKSGFGHATQEVQFYDCRFIGGKYAIGFGLDTPTQCSENMIINSEIAEAQYGLAGGSFNALANIAMNVVFRDNQITMGHGENLSGGTWAVLHGSITGTAVRDLELRNSASGIWYFYNLSSDTEKIWERPIGATGATFPLFFDHSFLSPVPPQDPVIDYDTGGGLMLLHSTLDPGVIRLGGGISVNYAAKLHSNVTRWSNIIIGSIHRAYELEVDIDGDGVFHPDDNCPTVSGSQTDTDGDGHGDICDCAPSDGTAFADPPEVMDLYFPDSSTLYWTTAAYAAGSGTTYDVYREGGQGTPAGAGTDPTCLGAGLISTFVSDTDTPLPGRVLRYFVRAVNACSTGTWGTDSDGTLRVITACP